MTPAQVKLPLWKRWWLWCLASLLLSAVLVEKRFCEQPAIPAPEKAITQASESAPRPDLPDDLSGFALGDAPLDAFLQSELRRWQADFGFDVPVFDDTLRAAVRAFQPFLFFNGGREAIGTVSRLAHDEAARLKQHLGQSDRAFGRIGREDALRKGTYLRTAIEQSAADWLQNRTAQDLAAALPAGRSGTKPAPGSPPASGPQLPARLHFIGGNLVNSAGRTVWSGRPDLPPNVNADLATAILDWIAEFRLSEEDIPALSRIVLCRLLLLQPDRLGEPPSEAARVRACKGGIAWLRATRDDANRLFEKTGWVNLPQLVRRSAETAARQMQAERMARDTDDGGDAGDELQSLLATSNSGGGIIQTSATARTRVRPALLTAPFDDAAAKSAQHWWAEGLKMPAAITNSVGEKLVLIPAGEFAMGSTPAQFEHALAADPTFSKEWQHEEQPQHPVHITQPFYLAVHEVTRAQFAQFVRVTGYQTDSHRDGKGGFGFNEATGEFKQNPKFDWQNPGFPQGDNEPVVNVSWNDASAFCAWLGRTESRAYRLPTEAEWEYACGAGSAGSYCRGDDPETLTTVANISDAAAKARFPKWNTVRARDGYVFTAPVGSFQPNAFGLFDMHGNVWEWCADWYGPDYYAKSPNRDPHGPAAGTVRVFRGGSWYDAPALCRSAFRYWDIPTYRDFFLGFRIAASPNER